MKVVMTLIMSKKILKTNLKVQLLSSIFLLFLGSNSDALQMDWGGQFWFSNDWLINYQLDSKRSGGETNQTYINNGSPYVPGAGEKGANWYSAFLKLNPTAIVNDSLIIKSELHLGSPRFGFLGRSYPIHSDEKFNFTGSQRDSFSVGAQRFWANWITDFGTFEVGRAPLDWGYGAVWNAGDNLFDRYQSTGDMVRLTSKFGNFYIQPAIVKIAVGENVSGATVSNQTVRGNDDVTDYDLALKYDNPEEDFAVGMMWTKRKGNTAQQTIYFNPNSTGSTRIDFNLFDFYTKKKWGRFTLGGEIPLYSGKLGALDGTHEMEYKAYAILLDGRYNSDIWNIGLKLGHVPGQPAGAAGDSKFRAIYLNKNYDLGLIMFHYNLHGLSQNNPDSVAAASVQSPYDAAIVNANYLALLPQVTLDRWTLKSAFILAYADETAKEGKRFYNHQRRKFYDAVRNQDSFLGWEVDFGVAFQWDDHVNLAWDFGLMNPGSYYEFTNDANVEKFDTSLMYASQVRLGVSF